MTDPTVFLGAVAATIGLIVIAIVGWKLRKMSTDRSIAERKIQEESYRKLVAQHERELKQKVAEGTHLADGRKRCTAHASCQQPAEHPRFRIVRDEGPVDLLRRAFGAPRRYRVEPSKPTGRADLPLATIPQEALSYCETHMHLAYQEILLKLAQHNERFVTFIRDEEVDLQWFERVGLDAKIGKLIADQEAKETGKKKVSKPNDANNKVVPISSRAASGTNG